MPIVQVPLDVSEDIYKGVLNGSFELLGIVKDGQHKVRKHILRAKMLKVDKATKVNKVGELQVIKSRIDTLRKLHLSYLCSKYNVNSV